MYARMVIGEAQNDLQVDEFARIFQVEVLPELNSLPGFHSANLIVEDGGTMAVSLTVWESRDSCLNYHSSLAYRRFVDRTQHLLIGDFVVKLFEVRA